MASRSQWITWFSTGKKPLGTQFADVLTLLFKKDEDSLPITSITNLQTVLNSKASQEDVDAINNQSVVLAAGTTSWVVPAGTLIEKFLIIAPTTITFKVGTTNGGNDVIEDFEVINWAVYTKDIYYSAETTIYFGGVAEDTIIKIFKR